jgi:hypothetical protein
VRNSVPAGLVTVGILDVVALALMWVGGDSFLPSKAWVIGFSILVVTGFPWNLLTELVDQDFLYKAPPIFFAILVVCSLLNGSIVGFLIGKLVRMHRYKAPTIRLK